MGCLLAETIIFLVTAEVRVAIIKKLPRIEQVSLILPTVTYKQVIGCRY